MKLNNSKKNNKIFYKTFFVFFISLSSFSAFSEGNSVLQAIKNAELYHDKFPQKVINILSPYKSELSSISWEERLKFHQFMIEAIADSGSYKDASIEIDRVLSLVPSRFHGHRSYLRIIIMKSYLMIEFRNMKEAYASVKRLNFLATKHNDVVGIVEAQALFSGLSFYDGDWKKSLAYLEKAYAILSDKAWEGVSEQEYLDLMGKIKYDLSALYFSIRPTEALSLLSDAIDIEMRNGNTLNAAMALRRMMLIYIAQGDFFEAKKSALALELEAKKLQKKSLLMSVYTNLSFIAMSLRDDESVERYLARAVFYKDSSTPNVVLSRYVLQCARLELHKGEPFSAISLLKKHEEEFFLKQESELEIEYYGLLALALLKHGDAKGAYVIEKKRLKLYRDVQEDKDIKLSHALAIKFERGREKLELRLIELDHHIASAEAVSTKYYFLGWLIVFGSIVLVIIIYLFKGRQKRMSLLERNIKVH